MGFHYEEAHILDGTIDNRVKGKTVIEINFTNQQSSVVTLQGNPSQDLAGSLWRFFNPEAQMEKEKGNPCFFIPAICEGEVGQIRCSRKKEVRILPMEEHYDLMFEKGHQAPPMKVAPVLELEWFSQKYQQVEIDCEVKQVELVEMGWVMTDEEAKRQEAEVEERREAMIMADEQDFEAGMELTEEYLAEEVEPHELEELCFLVIQNFVVKRAEMRGETEGLHSDLLKLQEQIALAFMHWDGEGDFDDEVDTVRLLEILIPFIDRAIESAKFASEETVQWLEQLRDGVTHLRDQLAG